MKEIILKVVTRKAIHFDLTREQMISFPTIDCRQWIYEEKLLIVEYIPAKTLGFNEQGFINLVKKIYKRDLKAHSVEVVDRWGKEIEG